MGPRMWNNKKLINQSFQQQRDCVFAVIKERAQQPSNNDLCPYACHQEMYEVEVSRTKMAKYPLMTALHFKFNRLEVERIKQTPAYTFESLFSNFGGACGLMCGTSVLSLFELIIVLVMFACEQ